MKIKKETVKQLRDTMKALHRASLYTGTHPEWKIVPEGVTTCNITQPTPPTITVEIGQACLNELRCSDIEVYNGTEYCYHVMNQAGKYLAKVEEEENLLVIKGWKLDRREEAFPIFEQIVTALGGKL